MAVVFDHATLREHLHSIRILAEAANFRIEEIGQIEALPILAMRREVAGVPRLYLSTGVHGDEPAGPSAIPSLLQPGVLPEGLDVTLLPCLNPAGLIRGTRDNADGIDVNRDYRTLVTTEARLQAAWVQGQGMRYDLALCLHEDWEATGFYLYDVRRVDCDAIASAVLKAAGAICGVESAEEIDGYEASNGRIQRHITDPDDPLLERPDLPEALWLFRHFTDICLTTETPSSQPLERRIEAQVAGILGAVGVLLSAKDCPE